MKKCFLILLIIFSFGCGSGKISQSVDCSSDSSVTETNESESTVTVDDSGNEVTKVFLIESGYTITTTNYGTFKARTIESPEGIVVDCGIINQQ